MASEISYIREYLKELRDQQRELRDEIKTNTELTREGFDKMNGRVKKLELSEANRIGRESVSKLADFGWKKLAFALVGIMTTATAIALVVVKAVFK